MKIGLAQIIQESNTFSPFKTELKDFYNQYFYLGKNIYSGFKNTKLEAKLAHERQDGRTIYSRRVIKFLRQSVEVSGPNNHLTRQW